MSDYDRIGEAAIWVVWVLIGLTLLLLPLALWKLIELLVWLFS